MTYQNISLERRKLVENWLETPPSKRPPLKEFRQRLHLSLAGFKFVKAQWEVALAMANVEQTDALRKTAIHRNARGRAERNGSERTFPPSPVVRTEEEFGLSKIEELGDDEPLEFEDISDGNHDKDVNIALRTLRRVAIEGSDAASVNAARTILQKYGLLTEKSETTHRIELSADDHVRIAKEANRRASDIPGAADGAKSLPPESSLLPAKIRAYPRPD